MATKICKDCKHRVFNENADRCSYDQEQMTNLVSGIPWYQFTLPTCWSERYGTSGICGEEGKNFSPKKVPSTVENWRTKS